MMVASVSVFFRCATFSCGLSPRALSLWALSLWALSLWALFPFSFLFFDLGLPVMYTRFKSIVVASWRSTSTMPEGNAKEDTWKCEVRICYDYLIATANCNYIGTQPADTLPDTWSSHSTIKIARGPPYHFDRHLSEHGILFICLPLHNFYTYLELTPCTYSGTHYPLFYINKI